MQRSPRLTQDGAKEVAQSGQNVLKSTYPCSAGQRRFWVRDQLKPGDSSSHVAVRWRLLGEISTAHLQQAFRIIIDRHEVLRSRFIERGGEPLQEVQAHVDFNVGEVDLSDLSSQAAFTEAERIAASEARTPFDLAAAPPYLRVTRLRLSPLESILLVTVHHIVSDGWSIGILADEMGRLCRDLQAKRAPSLPSLAVSYGEYCLWQQECVDETAIATDTAFWRRNLADLQYFELAGDHPRPRVQTNHGKILSRLLDRSLSDGLMALSRRQGCTLFMTSFAVLLTLLHRYSGETDIAVGTPVATRDEVQLESLIGLFVNTLVLRTDLSGDPTFEQLLERVQSSVASAFEHGQTPLESIIEIVKPTRDSARNPLFSIDYVLQRSFIDNARYGSFELVDMPSRSSSALYDLNFFMVGRPEGWRVSCEYNTDLFDSATIEAMLRHFDNLLHAVVATPSARISELDLLDATEFRYLAVDLNQTEASYPDDQTLPQLLQAQVERTPAATALVCGADSLSYAALDAAANRLARELQQRGTVSGQRVGILLKRSTDLVTALLAVLKLGAAYVPFDPAYPPERLTRMMNDAGIAVVVTHSGLADIAIPPALPRILVDADASSIAEQSDAALTVQARPTDPAYVIYTSGSTGTPKGVEISHRALINQLWAVAKRLELTAADVWVSRTMIVFDTTTLEIFLPLIAGARLVLAREPEAGEGGALLQLLRRHQATVMFATPAAWQILIEAGWCGNPRLKMLCGGEALSRNLADALLACGSELWNLYGMTETTVTSSMLRIEAGDGPVLLGPPIANTQFYVLDVHKKLVPNGVAGELYIGGHGVALGYLGRPQLNAERFLPDTFSGSPAAKLYRTGDRVRRRPGGTLEYLGRGDRQIKLRGFRIDLDEIESVLRRRPELKSVLVVLGRQPSGDQAIWAYVVPNDANPRETLVGHLRAGLAETLPRHMHPAAIMIQDGLPRMPNGKVDHKALPLPQAVERPPVVAADLTATEAQVAEICCAILGLDAIGLDDNFFELGGHSLLAARMLVRIRTTFGRPISLSALFAGPTVRELARKCDDVDGRTYDFRQAVPLQAGGSRPPLIAINNTGIYYVLSRRMGPDQPFTALQLFDPESLQQDLPQTLEDVAAGYVALIRQMQPQGPYALLGWCVAGTLAFEIARQLAAMHQTVSQLILIDTYVPGYLRRMPWLRRILADYSQRWKLILLDWARVRSQQQTFKSFLRNRRSVQRFERWLRLVPPVVADTNDARAVPQRDLTPEDYDRQLLSYLDNLATHYEPKPYEGGITLFRSALQPQGRFLDFGMGWGDYAGGGVEVVVVSGDHFSMFRDPGVERMAQHITAALDSERNRVNVEASSE